MEENSSVSEHMLKMSGLHNRLSQLGVNLPNDAVVDRILQSLPPSYKSFMMNFNMQGMEKTIPEVFAMLKSAEVEVRKEHQVLMCWGTLQKTKIFLLVSPRSSRSSSSNE